jgi:gamma-glutamyl-gamma-aminobutyrate hydrolase PuuD
MNIIAVSQRVVVEPRHGERRDALDQKWACFLERCGIAPYPVPNAIGDVRHLLDAIRPAGVLLTGGNDIAAVGGDAPERDETEGELIAYARENRLPLLGVCRGMQMIQHVLGLTLRPVTGHVATQQTISVEGTPTTVNSFHNFGTSETTAELTVWANADDGVVKAVRHCSEPLTGIMWHPERMSPFRAEDISLVRRAFEMPSVTSK